jgi:hypothetical protein
MKDSIQFKRMTTRYLNVRRPVNEGILMADFKFCTACGRKVALNAQFCTGCGAALGAKVTGVTKTPDFSELEGAYLARKDPELEKRVSDSLDAIAA